MLPVHELSLEDCKWWWKDAEAGDDQWRRCSTFPTNIHHELKVGGLVPDEGAELNEGTMQWVFKTEFASPSKPQQYDSIVLPLDGLDKIAKIWLNGEVVLECDNVSMPQRVDVSKYLVLGRLAGDNELEIHFQSAARLAREGFEKGGLN